MYFVESTFFGWGTYNPSGHFLCSSHWGFFVYTARLTPSQESGTHQAAHSPCRARLWALGYANNRPYRPSAPLDGPLPAISYAIMRYGSTDDFNFNTTHGAAHGPSSLA